MADRDGQEKGAHIFPPHSLLSHLFDIEPSSSAETGKYGKKNRRVH